MVTQNYSDLEIPFGMRADGTMVGAAQPGLPNGLACGCVCPNASCRAPLVACNEGDQVRPYFRHAATRERGEAPNGDDVSGASCVAAGETAIHLMAKQIIARDFTILLPPVVAIHHPMPVRTLHESETDLWHKLSHVRLESWCEGFRPDIFACYSGHIEDGNSRPFAIKGDAIAIEIRVTHPCEPEKIEKFRTCDMQAIEIDLSRERYRADAGSLADAINNAPRIWLFHPLIDKAIASMQNQQAIGAIEQMQLNSAGRSSGILPQRAEVSGDPEDRHKQQIAGLRRYDAAAWRNYNYNDERERAVMENILVQPWPRTKR